MAHVADDEAEAHIAQRFCRTRGAHWSVIRPLGKGGTAPVYEVDTPGGLRALKIYDEIFSSGDKGKIEEQRVRQQVALRGHSCPSLVQVYDGGRFEGRLFLLMSRAPGRELEKLLREVPRTAIRTIVRQVAEAAIFLRSRDLCHRDIKAANVFVSDDYSHATLLDISVVRGVHDPIGLGTDHDGMLPVVATARYSPPEYLFRLLDPGPELWHSLTVYQLGGLLHDLIMRVPLFQEEYEKAKANRYRFAWIVATTVPRLEFADVDKDLVLLALRALDKDWHRRSELRLEDFLLDARDTHRKHALRALGVGIEPRAGDKSSDYSQRLIALAKAIEQLVIRYFAVHHLTVTHVLRSLSDTRKTVTFGWDTRTGFNVPHTRNEFIVSLELVF